jgi:AraC-like DNA-binding protein
MEGDGMTISGRDRAKQMTTKPHTIRSGDFDIDNPRRNFSVFESEKRRSWDTMSVDVVKRAPGEAVCRSICHRLTYMLTDFDATMEDDDRPAWKSRLRRGTFVYRPPDTTLTSHLTAGRYIQILQSRETYDNLALQMIRGGVLRLEPRYTLKDPRVSQLVSTIAEEMAGGVFDQVLADSLNTALAVRISRRFVEASAMALAPANGLSCTRLQRVRDYIEAHLTERLSLHEIAEVACLSPYHFSRSFKQSMGVGPHHYIVQRRIEKAKILMRRTGHPLGLIAQEVGFTDQSHLTAAFRREIGVTPGIFRAEVAREGLAHLLGWSSPHRPKTSGSWANSAACTSTAEIPNSAASLAQ